MLVALLHSRFIGLNGIGVPMINSNPWSIIGRGLETWSASARCATVSGEACQCSRSVCVANLSRMKYSPLFSAVKTLEPWNPGLQNAAHSIAPKLQPLAPLGDRARQRHLRDCRHTPSFHASKGYVSVGRRNRNAEL
jgi:hypothetical protein